VRFPYVVGAMANGIATTRMVVAAAKAGLHGLLRRGGLGLPQVEPPSTELPRGWAGRRPWGANLIHAPQEPGLEARTAELFLRRRGARASSASAFMRLTARWCATPAAG
jgi:trans-AT polyketide synthase/acyltransferase/oxidoreductase domain-containing protein